MSKVVVVVLSLVVAALAARSAAQQMPRDRTLSDQRATERAAFDRKAAELEQAAAQQAGNAQAQHLVATFYYERSRDAAISADERRGYIDRGIAAEDRALAADPEYVEALVYKNILLRTKATMESDPAVQAALVRDADALRNRALELAQAQRAKAIPAGTVVNTNVPPPPPPPPPPGGASEPIKWVYAETQVTAAAEAPVKTKDVRPIFAPMVIASGYKGEVVLEADVDARGKVAQVRVIQSQPMLTQAAIDAVRQWEFDPATVASGGSKITVTANFTPPAR
jgi:TonB family protein